MALNTPQQPVTATPKTPKAQQQLAASAPPPPRVRKSAATRALCRQTRAAVESWLEKLLGPEQDKPLLLQQPPRSSDGATVRKARRKELTRRASTGSLLGKGGDGADESRARRAIALFSLRSGGGDKENSGAGNNRSKDQAGMWLKPVATLSELASDVDAASAERALGHAPPQPLKEPMTPESDCSGGEQQPELELFAYVMPPVEMPSHYRIQDRRGGMIVAGRAVLFTNAAFKRKLRNLSQLRAIPEHQPAQLQDSRLDAFLYGLQHFASPPGSFATEADVEPLSQWI